MLTKPQIIAEIHALTGDTRKNITLTLDALAVVAERELNAGNAVSIPGIVKLARRTRAARLGRNPATGAEVQIPAKTIVTAKASKSLTDKIAP
jgi:DNA-binding protein HU-beta